MSIKIYHNPRCSKSREALDIIRQNGHEPKIVEYLKEPLNTTEIHALAQELRIGDIREMMRTKEAVYKDLGLGSAHLSNEQLIEAMNENPILIERPIVVTPKGAVIARPPQRVLEIL